MKEIIVSRLAFCAALLVITLAMMLPALSRKKTEATSSNQKRLIKPLFKKSEKTSSASKKKKEYVELPPWGYVPRKEDRRSKKGRALYDKMNCRQCHSIRGEGGELGPPLDGIGGHRGPQWLVARMMDPEQQTKKFAVVFGNIESVMPHPGVNEKEAKLLVDYLLTLPEPKEGYLVAGHSTELKKRTSRRTEPDKSVSETRRKSALRGAKVFYSAGCYACHSTDGSADRFGPDLAGISGRADVKRLTKLLRSKSRSHIMQVQVKVLTDEQVKDLAEFLAIIPGAEKQDQGPETAPTTSPTTSPTKD